MQLEGTVIKVFPKEAWTKKDGSHGGYNQNILISVGDDDRYAKPVLVNCQDPDKMKLATLTEGEYINLDVVIQSREYNGKWYSQISSKFRFFNNNG